MASHPDSSRDTYPPPQSPLVTQGLEEALDFVNVLSSERSVPYKPFVTEKVPRSSSQFSLSPPIPPYRTRPNPASEDYNPIRIKGMYCFTIPLENPGPR